MCRGKGGQDGRRADAGGWEECACGVEPVVVEVSESWLVGSQDMAGGSLRAWGSLGKPDTRDSWPFLSEVKAWV
jgi:hypothetical protein